MTLAVGKTLRQLLLEGQSALRIFVDLSVGGIDAGLSEYFFLPVLVHLGVGDFPLVIGVFLLRLLQDALIFVPDLCSLHD